MCDGCLIDKDSLGKIFPDTKYQPGWELIHASDDTYLLSTNQWGLMYNNTLVCKWNSAPILDPYIPKANRMPEDEFKKYTIKTQEYMEASDEFIESLRLRPNEGYRLMKAMKAAGFKESYHGLGQWLFEHLATFILEQQATPEWKQKVGVPGYVLTNTDVDILKVLQKKNRNKKC